MFATPGDPASAGARTAAASTRERLDALIVAAVVTYMTWGVILSSIDTFDPGDLAHTSAAVGTLAGSVLIATALIAADRADPPTARPARLMAAGIAAIGLATNLGAWLTVRGSSVGAVSIDGVILLGALVCGLGARRACVGPTDDSGAQVPDGLTTSRSRRLANVITPAAVVVAMLGATAFRISGAQLAGFELWGVMTIMLLGLTRQALTLRENARLTAQLRAGLDALRHQATHDDLTGLPVRQQAMDMLVRMLAELNTGATSDSGSTRGIAVLFLDIDRFKHINDSLGHNRGDVLLIETARRIVEVLGTEAVVSRFGGDEFLVVLDYQHPRDLVRLTENIRFGVSRPVILGGVEVVVTTSIGVATAQPGITAPDAEELVTRADLALYEAKREGRNQAQPFTPGLDATSATRLALANGLRRALAQDEFEVFYQPIVDLATSQISGAEALLRWNHPTNGVLLPEDWLPVAEDIGLLADIGRATIIGTCRRFAAINAARADHPLTVAINLSRAELRSAGLVEFVHHCLSSSGLEPRCLTLEVSEQHVSDPNILETLGRLHELGIRLSVDDFGTGYSALGQLRRFPVQELKVDRSFVVGLDEDDVDLAIVTAVLDLGKALGLQVVAEGIATEAQAERLRRLGCHFGQGFHYGRAVPFGRYLGLLERMEEEREAANDSEASPVADEITTDTTSG